MRYLISADIHLDDYSHYNYTNRFRLNQFTKLADRLVELAKENNCKELMLLGDTLNRPTNRPYIINVLYQFLNKISNYFDNIYYILGQHDLDSKSNDVNTENTILSIFEDNPKFHYMHRKQMEIDGCKMAFLNWMPDPDVTWIDGKVDYLLTHFTKSTMFGQTIDESKFDYMIHGDIHNDQVVNQYISVGNPIQHDMNSQPDGTCIVLNTEDKSWYRIQVDEDRSRFLRIRYTPVADEEGFSEGGLLYKIYIPPRVKASSKNVELPNWSNIQELINSVISSEDLLDIHQEVLARSPKYEEINFDYQLVYLKVKGFRSVTDFELRFDKGDRVVLQGMNGSGKSSIIKALRNMFTYNRYLDSERSDLTDSMSIELGIEYEGKLYEIRKGDRWQLTIDGGSPEQYNNKTQFEGDLIEKLPFMRFIDIFFIMSGTQNLSNQFSEGRRIELISKFYRLDRLNAYSQCSIGLSEAPLAEKGKLLESKTKLIGQLELINKKLTELDYLKDIDKSNILNELESIKVKKSMHEKYLSWKYEKETTEFSINQLRTKLESIESWRCNADEVKNNLESLKGLGTQLKSELDSLNNELSELKSIDNKIETLTNTGKRLASELESLKKGVCPLCGHSVSDESLVASKSSELDKLRNDYALINSEYSKYKYPSDRSKYNSRITEINTQLDKMRSDYSELNHKLELNDKYESVKSDNESQLVSLTDKLTMLTQDSLIDIEITPELIERESQLNRIVADFNMYDSHKSEIASINIEIETITIKISEKDEKLLKYNRYADLLSRTGKIYEEILTKLASAFSNEEVLYEVDAGVYRNKKYIDFNMKYKVGKKFRPYSSLSDGQKSVCDLNFLNNLYSVKVGLLCLDEHLKHLDDQNLPKASKILSELNVNTVIISTHDPNFIGYTKKIKLELDSDGATRYIIENG